MYNTGDDSIFAFGGAFFPRRRVCLWNQSQLMRDRASHAGCEHANIFRETDDAAMHAPPCV